MEQLIIFIIIAIVSSLFNKSKNNKEQKQMPPFNKDVKSQPPVVQKAEEPKAEHPTLTPQSFEDFARKFLGDIQDEQSPKNTREEHVKPVVEETVQLTPNYVAPSSLQTELPRRTMERTSIGRLAVGKKEVHSSTTNTTFELPTSKQTLMQAIVMAEVLGPPKAKRK